MFYPQDTEELRRTVQSHLDAAKVKSAGIPKAVIAPHAGYIYSGPVAGAAFKCLAAGRETIRRVVLFGPCHRVPLKGMALSSADSFLTPLGAVSIDRESCLRVEKLPGMVTMDRAHEQEHSLEVQLPFLQVILKEFVLVPIAVGIADDRQVAEVMEALYGGPETCILASSDLSHFLDHETARQTDQATCKAIENLRPETIGPHDACGEIGVRGLLRVAKNHGLKVQTLDLRDSSDTAGDPGRVVGYGAWAFN